MYDRAMEQDRDDKITATELPTMMTVPEVIELLRISRGSVYQGLKTGEIPGARTVGRTIRVHRPTLEKWLESGELPPRSRARSRRMR